ncbi:hypothetical protein MRX96_031543 [Rhipicephalus microplus]
MDIEQVENKASEPEPERPITTDKPEQHLPTVKAPSHADTLQDDMEISDSAGSGLAGKRPKDIVGEDITTSGDGAPPAKRKAPNEPTTSQACDDAAAGEETAQAPHPFHSITPPSAFCSKICLPSNPEALCFAWHYNTVPGDVCVLKHVVFSSSKEVGAADGYLCSTYCHGINVEEHYVSTETDALASLKRADDLLLCCGCEIEPAAGTAILHMTTKSRQQPTGGNAGRG